MSIHKIKLNVTITMYVNSDWYEEGTTPQQMAAIEAANCQGDPWPFVTDEDAEIEVTGEAVEEERPSEAGERA